MSERYDFAEICRRKEEELGPLQSWEERMRAVAAGQFDGDDGDMMAFACAELADEVAASRMNEDQLDLLPRWESIMPPLINSIHDCNEGHKECTCCGHHLTGLESRAGADLIRCGQIADQASRTIEVIEVRVDDEEPHETNGQTN